MRWLNMQLADIGFMLILAGIVIVIIGFLLIFRGEPNKTDVKKKVDAGGVIFIGPIPIVFGTSKKIFIISLILATFILLLLLVSFITLL